MRKKNVYFTKDTENAIVKYNVSDNQSEREKLFRQHIGPAFDKLAEILIRKHKFYYVNNNNYEETKLDVIEFLLEKLPKYQREKGKAYSYFTIVARNYLIIRNRNSYKKIVQKKQLSGIDYRNEIRSSKNDEFKNKEKMSFFELFFEYLKKNSSEIFKKKNDFAVADSILEIIKRRNSFENLNKKAIYIMIKERTGLKAQQITKVVNILKSIYSKVYSDYARDGHIDVNKIYEK